jgi:uncharacterized protein
MTKLPSRLRRLEDALYALPDDCMLLSDLDGYLTGLVLCPEAIPSAEWLPVIWGGVEAGPPFEDPLDVQDFTTMLEARHAEVARDLGRGKVRPMFDVDPRNGELLWEPWIDGFATAMDLRPDSWAAVAGDAGAADAIGYLTTLIAVADDSTDLPSEEINALYDGAAEGIPLRIAALYAWQAGQGTGTVSDAPSSKVGRNDPCPCGSGKKHKKCCGAD